MLKKYELIDTFKELVPEFCRIKEQLGIEMRIGEYTNGVLRCSGCGDIVIIKKVFKIKAKGREYNVCHKCFSEKE